MAAARAFGVERVNRPALERGYGIFDEAALVQRIRVDQDLHIHVVRDGQTAIDGGWRCTPIFMKLKAASSRLDLLDKGSWRTCVAFCEKAEVHGKAICGLEHPLNVPRT